MLLDFLHRSKSPKSVEDYYSVLIQLNYDGAYADKAQAFFSAFFERGIPVGQIRTQLGRPGQERTGPEAAARALLEWIQNHP